MDRDLKTHADRVVEALKRDPELYTEVENRLATASAERNLQRVKERLADPVVEAPGKSEPDDTKAFSLRHAYGVLLIEHEFGQRDEGWTLFATRAEGEDYRKKNSGPLAPAGQYWTYKNPQPLRVTAAVWQLLKRKGILRSKDNHWPSDGTVVTTSMILL